jgi:hypothetical protein
MCETKKLEENLNKKKQKKTESMCEATKNGRKLTKKLEEN